MGLVFAQAFDLAMQIEREQFLGAQQYERSSSRQGYANGYKAKRIDTPAGTVTVNVPKTAGHDGEPFYPQSLERGFRSTRSSRCSGPASSENASRLAAMQRAEKNIDDLLEELNRRFHRLRQSAIDDELFDVISGYESLSAEKRAPYAKE
jgi:ATP synthase/Transposase, Mutator family